jgi:DNA-binding CsgD family transcriptional regulator
MSKSQRLRLSEVRRVYHLIWECRELGADAHEWRRHLLTGLLPLIGMRVALSLETPLSMPLVPAAYDEAVEVGWPSTAARMMSREYLLHEGPAHDPFLKAFMLLPGRLVTRSPGQVIGDRAWFGCAVYNEFFRPAGIGDGGMSRQVIAAGRALHCLAFFRSLGERPVESRERRLVHLVQQEIGPLIGGPLASGREPGLSGLAPRLRQVLACLLEGDGEKQIALRLGVSQPTVHQYVTTLYRHFGVGSRAELLASFLRRFRRGGGAGAL